MCGTRGWCCSRCLRPRPRGNRPPQEPWAGAAALAAGAGSAHSGVAGPEANGSIVVWGACAVLAAPRICPPSGFPVRCPSSHGGGYHHTATLFNSFPWDCRLCYFFGQRNTEHIELPQSSPCLPDVFSRGAVFLSVPVPCWLRARGTACPSPSGGKLFL